MKDILSKISIGLKGHWGVIEPLHRASNQAWFLNELSKLVGWDVLELNCEARFSSVDNAPEEAVTAAIKRELADIRATLDRRKEGNRRVLCCVVTKFHRLSTSMQLQLLEETRSIRETPSDIAFQTVFFGSWNRYRLVDAWKGRVSSPVLDQKNITALYELDFSALLERLVAEKWLSDNRSEIDDINVNAFSEFTGGDNFVVDEVLAALRAERLSLRDFHEVLDGVANSNALWQEIERRMACLSDSALTHFRRIADNQVCCVNARDADVEDLRIVGLVSLERLAGTVIATVTSSVLDATLRCGKQFISPTLANVRAGGDLLRPLATINTHAYRLVLEIETLLRNWMVSCLSEIGDADWRTQAKGVKVPGSDAEIITEEVKIMGDKLFTAVHPEVDLSKVISEAAAPSLKPAGGTGGASKRPMVGVIEAAEEWKRRWEKHPSVRLSETGLPSFLTTGALMNIYMAGGRIGEIVSGTFGSREEAKVFLAKFSVVRSAVAHNQSLALSTVEELISLKKELCVRLSSSSSVSKNK